MTPTEALDRIVALCDEARRTVGNPGRWLLAGKVRAVLAEVTPEAGAHLDPKQATETLDWCKREGGLDLYGWGELISRLQDCIVPLPADAPSKVSAAYRQGYQDASAEVTPGTGGVLDRDQARDALRLWDPMNDSEDWLLDRLAGCVRPATIDRDALDEILFDIVGDDDELARVREAVLALVRPVAGVTLTPEEAATVLDWYRGTEAVTTTADAAIAARLEAAQ